MHRNISRSIFYWLKRSARKNGAHATASIMFARMADIPVMTAAYALCGSIGENNLVNLHKNAKNNKNKFGLKVASNYVRQTIRGKRLIA